MPDTPHSVPALAVESEWHIKPADDALAAIGKALESVTEAIKQVEKAIPSDFTNERGLNWALLNLQDAEADISSEHERLKDDLHGYIGRSEAAARP